MRKKKMMQQWIAVMMVFSLSMTFTLTGAVYTACAGERLLTGTTGIIHEDVNRQRLKKALLDIGYDENEATDAIADLSREEIDMLAANPGLLVRTGNAAVAVVAVLFLTTLCDDDDNRSEPQTTTTATRRPAPQTTSQQSYARPDPTPIEGNSGMYMCPYTQDGVLAEWTDMAISVKLGKATGSVVGTAAGAYAGKELAKNLPIPGASLLGGFLGGAAGKKVGSSAGRKIGLEAAGGMENIRQTSDLSFNDLKDMRDYLYANHSNHEHFRLALQITAEIYPDFKKYIH